MDPQNAAPRFPHRYSENLTKELDESSPPNREQRQDLAASISVPGGSTENRAADLYLLEVTSSEDADDDSVTLDSLPPEILVIIASYLTPREVILGLSATNRALHQIFQEEEYWRVRIKQRWHATYPIIPDSEEIAGTSALWPQRCHYRELQFDNFKYAETRMNKRVFGIEQGGLHFGDIDAMSFGGDGRFLATGGRDRQVIVWNLKAIKEFPDGSPESVAESAQTVLHTHQGWVWSLQSLDHSISSGAWDTTINIADLNHPLVAQATTLKCAHAVTSHCWERQRLVAGTILGAVAVFDPRAGVNPLLLKSQKQSEAVLGIQLVDNYVIVVGSDRKLQALDLRNQEFVIKKNIPENDFGTKLHAVNGHLWVGTKKGKVLLYDMKQNFEILEDFTERFGHTDHITGLHYDDGHILTCCLDKQAKMFQPTRRADLIWQTDSVAGFTAMDYSSDCTLALSWGPVVGLWWPK